MQYIKNLSVGLDAFQWDWMQYIKNLSVGLDAIYKEAIYKEPFSATLFPNYF